MGPDTAGSIAIPCNTFPQYKILSATGAKFLSLVQDLGFYIHFIALFSLGKWRKTFIFQHVKNVALDEPQPLLTLCHPIIL